MDIFALLPDFGGVPFTVLAFIIALSVIIAVHEYGHYIVGRWSGIGADVFSIGFGPVLWSRRDRRGTRWQIAALPFGGFVRFKGDSNAASGKDSVNMASMSRTEMRQTMHGAPLWARAATVFAGPLFNFALSLIVFAGIALTAGIPKLPLTIERLFALPDGTHEIREGDTLIAIEGIAFGGEDFRARLDSLPDAEKRLYSVIREGRETPVIGPALTPPRAGGVDPMGAAYLAGVREGDVILSVDGAEARNFNDLIAPISSSNGKPVMLEVWRDGEIFDLTVTPVRRDLPRAEGGFETRWLIGISGDYFFVPKLETPGPMEAAGLGAQRIWDITALTFSGLYHMVTGAIGSCNVSGPIGIAQMSGMAANQGAVTFIMFIGFLSTAVGLLNLLPVPILDGGHLAFFAYEAIVGRPPGDRAMRILMTVGLALLISLMAFAVTNDLLCP